MRAWLLTRWDNLMSSYWFVPSLMAFVAFGLSVLTMVVDRSLDAEDIKNLSWLSTLSPSGARGLLSVIASSLIGLAGVVFSITIVALTLASSQFGPRLLRNFMRDRGNQVVLGTFVSAFLFSLLALRQVRGGGDADLDDFVPQISVLTAVLLALAGLVVLIYFIHHVSSSIQAPQVVASVARDLCERIDTLYPEHFGGAPPEEAPEDEDFAASREAPAVVRAQRSGYLQRIDPEALLSLADSKDLVVRAARQPGHFVGVEDAVLEVWPASRVDEDVESSLRRVFIVADQRSLAQDAAFALDQLVEIAVRALSPGVNDPFTAIQCIDQLGECLARWAGRKPPAARRHGEDGTLRVIAPPMRFRHALDNALDPIRQNSRSALQVQLRLLEALARIAAATRLRVDRARVLLHLKLVVAEAHETAQNDHDREAIEERRTAVDRALLDIEVSGPVVKDAG